MKTISAELDAHLQRQVTTLCTCWRIVRLDGVEFNFTNLDRDIEFPENSGTIYKTNIGFSQSNLASDSSFGVNNTDIQGIFNSDDLNAEDLRKGLFNYATVFTFMVNYEDLTQLEIKLGKYNFGEVTVNDADVFVVEQRGITQALKQQNIIEVYAAECSTDLGSSLCKAPIIVQDAQRSTAYVLDDYVRVRTDTFVPTTPTVNLVSNPRFENGTTSWLGSTRFLTPTSFSGLVPFVGSNFLLGPNLFSQTIYQTIDLLTAGVLASDIDSGSTLADLTYQRANATSSAIDRGGARFRFQDASFSDISTAYDSGAEVISPQDTWFPRGITQIPVPVNTRHIRIELYGTSYGGARNDSCWDDILVQLFIPVAGFAPTSFDYENRVYKCTTAGITDAIEPTYDTTIGLTTTDGTAVFTAEKAFLTSAIVTEVINNRKFKVELLTPNTDFPTSWFNGGAILWESGLNAGKTTEVKLYIKDDNIIIEQELEMFLAAPYNITLGDILAIYPGCDKRLSTCINKFNNSANFRGFPHVPGPMFIPSNLPEAKG